MSHPMTIKNGRRKFRPLVPNEGRGYKRPHGEQADFSSFEFISVQFWVLVSEFSVQQSSVHRSLASRGPHHRAVTANDRTHLRQQDDSSGNDDRSPDQVFTGSDSGQAVNRDANEGESRRNHTPIRSDSQHSQCTNWVISRKERPPLYPFLSGRRNGR